MNLGKIYDGWPSAGRDLVEKAIAAHGGLGSWRGLHAIRFPFVAASGLLLWLKGYGRTFGAPREYEVRPHERTTIFHGYPDDAHIGRFVDGTVSIERVGESAPSNERANHRDTFRGIAKYRRWDHLDALYFFGYALWHYHVVPFTLGEARFLKLVRSKGRSGVAVELPSDVHTHCRRQRFFFDESGRITRHDYVAEIIGSWARGAHLWEDYQNVGGIPVACRRRVSARLWRQPTPLTVLKVSLGAPSLQSPTTSGARAPR